MATAMAAPLMAEGVAPHVHQEGDPHLLPQGVDDGADEQGAEQALGHGPQGVDAVALGEMTIFFLFRKAFQLFHRVSHPFSV